MKMKLVRFYDGKYGVKTWSWFWLRYVYWYFPTLPFINGWWSVSDEHPASWHTDEENARNRIKMGDKGEITITDYGKEVK